MFPVFNRLVYGNAFVHSLLIVLYTHISLLISQIRDIQYWIATIVLCKLMSLFTLCISIMVCVYYIESTLSRKIVISQVFPCSFVCFRRCLLSHINDRRNFHFAWPDSLYCVIYGTVFVAGISILHRFWMLLLVALCLLLVCIFQVAISVLHRFRTVLLE